LKIIPFETEEQWHAIRQQHIGSSEIAAIFHSAPEDQPQYIQSHFALWQVKAGRIPPPSFNNKRTKWGLLQEQVIAQAMAEEFGWTIEKGPYVAHETVRGLGSSLDYIITGGPEVEKFGGPGVLECKNVDWMIHRRQWTDDEPPVHILLQHQHQLSATAFKWGAVGCLVGGNDLKRYDYERHDKTIRSIEKRVTDFWVSIDKGEEPPVDNRPSTAAALQALYAKTDTEGFYDCTNDLDMPERVAQLRQARLDIRAAEAQELAAANWIMHRIKDKELVLEGDLPILTAKVTKRKGFKVEPTSFRAIRLKDSV
jgi:predicted phage-related endonuclease